MIWINSLKNYDIVLSKHAKADLTEIKSYSNNEWGKNKSQEYLARIKSSLQNLRSHPKIGSKREDISSNLRSLNIIRHNLYYEIIENQIHIQRILHERMDPERYLKKKKKKDKYHEY